MTEPNIGIQFTGNAAAVSPSQAAAVKALAECVTAWAHAVEVIAQRLEGTPGITNSSISGATITQGQAPAVVKPKRRTTRRKK